MNFEQYQPLAIKTESVPTSLVINEAMLHASLNLAIAASVVMDQVKRRLYYGTQLNTEKLLGAAGVLQAMTNYIGGATQHTASGEADVINNPFSEEELADMRGINELSGLALSNLNVRLLHSTIGSFTEAGEKLEAMLKQFETGQLDVINLAEEFGDDNWYDATGKDELTKVAALEGKVVTDATIRLANITKLQGNAKLKGRYNDGDFDIVAALTRDLANERAALNNDLTGLSVAGPVHLNPEDVVAIANIAKPVAPQA